MPLYDYECSKHGVFERIGPVDDTPQFCPKCGGLVKKLPALFAIDKQSKMGHTRMELFDNLAKEGNGQKDWRDYDTYYQEAIGIPPEERYVAPN